MSTSLKIVLRSADLMAAREFYEGALGLEVVDQWSESHGDGCIYKVGEGLIELNDGAPEGSMDRFDLQIKVDDLDHWVDRLQGKVDFVGPKAHPWGETTVRLHDPDGTLITIFAATG